MADLTPEELDKRLKDLDQAESDLQTQAGETAESANALIEPMRRELLAQKAKMSDAEKLVGGQEVDRGQWALRNLPPLLGGAALEGVGARVASNPALAESIAGLRPGLRHVMNGIVRMAPMLGEFVGVGGGDVAGRALTGQPQNLPETATMATTASLAGGGYRALTRGVGGLGQVPPVAVEEAGIPKFGVLPNIKAVTRPYPNTPGQVNAGISSESMLATRLASAVSKLENMMTEPRRLKMQHLGQAEANGVRIDPTEVVDFLANEIPTIKIEPTTAGAFHDYFNNFVMNLEREAYIRGGTFSPLEWDEFIRTNLAPKSYTGTGNPAENRIGPVVRKAKEVAGRLLTEALPQEVRALNKKISDQLDLTSDASDYFGPYASGIENRLKTIRSPGNENRIKALRWLSDNTDKTLFKRVTENATRRAFTVDLRDTGPSATVRLGSAGPTAGSRMGGGLARFMAPGQPHVGPLTGVFLGPNLTGAATSTAGYARDKTADLLEYIRRIAGVNP